MEWHIVDIRLMTSSSQLHVDDNLVDDIKSCVYRCLSPRFLHNFLEVEEYLVCHSAKDWGSVPFTQALMIN
jgi:hypothetical protein